MSKQFLTNVIQQNSDLNSVTSRRLADAIVDAITSEITGTGGYTLPSFGTFRVVETAKRAALNPRTGEKVSVKAGATVRFKASPVLKTVALEAMKKARRKAKKSGA
jgi:DNA-binding protein HU-beta